MGGSAGGLVTKIGGGLTKAATLGLSDKIRYKGQSLSNLVGNPYDAFRDINSADQTAANNGFGFDPNQSANDQAAINAEGSKQYDQTLAGINDLGTAQTQRAKDLFSQMLPDIAENSQAQHLYDSTGYGNEVARQQSSIASQIAEQEAQQRLAALGAKQGFQTGALQRGMSLADFVNQANVAKSIGATMAPQAPNSKATGLSGATSGAAAGAPFGPWGAAIGGGVGLLAGSQASNNPRGGK